ncbi:thiol-disulfide oxidoreductase YkuV [Alicyclobacillus cellulosilyticus]|uniref:Thiol-disulfide oxidoreductase YkuV n=1 Tax=Alicyclobacillus cellulosilyticus TaxID=1003997 RepID=A0A917NGY0_9BACL|nr:redoxin domain-containing protein [Alicyclobacillus cellulosilyticus]GGJ00267.1 thiol-disulfide oxidoreductase YkuV [Alicyclobacillus cellulosilyticus]
MPMRLGSPLPPLDGATQWLNTDQGAAEIAASLAGAPALIHFWAVSCHICHETMPSLITYRDEFAPHGLKTVAVHMPRQEADTDVAKVQADIQRYGITHPVAIDNLHQVAKAFQNEYVPAFFLFDPEGKLFFRTAGDKGFEKLRPKIQQLLGLAET